MANRISVLRLALIPVCVGAIALYDGTAQWPRILALAAYTVAALSDALDGYVARHFNQQTELGRVLDPLADKLLVNLTFIFLAVNAHLETAVPLWLPVFIFGRDAFITGGSYLIKRVFGDVEIHPRFLGKSNTFVESAAAIGILAELPFAADLLVLLVVVGIASWLDYLAQGLSQTLRRRRA